MVVEGLVGTMKDCARGWGLDNGSSRSPMMCVLEDACSSLLRSCEVFSLILWRDRSKVVFNRE